MEYESNVICGYYSIVSICKISGKTTSSVVCSQILRDYVGNSSEGRFCLWLDAKCQCCLIWFEVICCINELGDGC